MLSRKQISELSSHFFEVYLQALSSLPNPDLLQICPFLILITNAKVIGSGVTTMGDHKEHMCEYAKHHNVDQMRERVKNAKFICEVCGRAANSKDYLCRPVDL
jgi:hypothetical protein